MDCSCRNFNLDFIKDDWIDIKDLKRFKDATIKEINDLKVSYIKK